MSTFYPKAEGLYDPKFEHDACGVGMMVDIEGRKSHGIVRNTLEILENLTHRGAVGSDPDSGDGAGIMLQTPDAFFRKAANLGFELPPHLQYAVGMVYLPIGKSGACQEMFNKQIADAGAKLLGWRQVPVNAGPVGLTARNVMPEIWQVFIANPGLDEMAFARKLYVIRRLTEKEVEAKLGDAGRSFYVCSLSARTIVYKGMMVSHQVDTCYPDLSCEEVVSAIALVHSRYSTNTFPSWPLAHPFRMVCHNGEINTLRGNINKMVSRHASLASKVWGDELQRLLPVIIEGASDSACFDNMLELLWLSGRSLPHAILMMIPEAWGEKYYMGHDRRGFYEYHANFMEPWDGPACIAFSDGVIAGGILDRNGLRPARYSITRQGQLILGSETGALEIPQEDVVSKGRLQPGKMMVVDTAQKRVLYNDEIKARICRQQHYRRWVDANRITFEGFGTYAPVKPDPETLLARQIAFGYTREDINVLMRPMAATGQEPIGSMGNDTPLAVLSDKPQLLYNYFRQNFAQVTNPPIDPIREDLVMSMTTFLGAEGNLLEETPEHARRMKLKCPILTDADLQRIRDSRLPEFRVTTLDALFDAQQGEAGLEQAMERLCADAVKATEEGNSVIVLSDRKMDPRYAPVPGLLAVSGVHHALVRLGIRSRVGLVLESGEPREVNHCALLLAYGVQAINPYLAYETIAQMHAEGVLPKTLSQEDAVENFIHAIDKGVRKILSKMGISTLRSYSGAQIYEAVGLGRELVDKYFTKTTSRIGGIGITHVARETLMRFEKAYEKQRGVLPALDAGGFYSYRRDGERHLWTPETIHYLQQATRRNDPKLFAKFSESINNQENRHVTLRSLFDFKKDGLKPVALDEVEPAKELVKRFMTGAMSFGSLSREVHEAMAIAMNRLGGMSNCGEGGEDPLRFVPMPSGDSKNSAVKQVASGRFGVTIEYLASAKDIQIKIAQGAKPGEGGHLPGDKVNKEIASVRNSMPGVSLISPPPHHDIYSIEDLAQLIYDLKNANPGARVSVKLVSESGVGTIAAGVSKGKADMVLISGGDGGTGASPLSSIKFAGMPWELGLSETHQTLVKNDLRSRIRVQTDGQMRTGRDIAIAAMLGAEEFGFGTGALIVMGCVMMRKCQLNTCPVGVATQDERLRKRFNGAPEYLQNFMFFVAEELRQIMAELGVRTLNELVGRADLLTVRGGVTHWKAKTLNFADVFHRPDMPPAVGRYCMQAQDHGLEAVLDRKLIAEGQAAIQSGKKVEQTYPIKNTDRTVGATLSYEIAKRYGHKGLPDETIRYHFKGSAGQSFGAFLARGVTFMLKGDANDYVGKGLSGGRIAIAPADEATFPADENVIVGNTVLYGATSGEVYFAGLGGERFAVRNSGVNAVVEGVGDHGCEYMTGGRVVVLGPTGVNFAAGMSGGIAYVYDPQQDFDLRCNLGMVDLDPITDPEDEAELRGLIEKHVHYTSSARGKRMLENWDSAKTLFVKVFPMEYRRALGQMKKVESQSRKTEAEKVEQA